MNMPFKVSAGSTETYLAHCGPEIRQTCFKCNQRADCQANHTMPEHEQQVVRNQIRNKHVPESLGMEKNVRAWYHAHLDLMYTTAKNAQQIRYATARPR